jgi:hypothetical protein
MRIIPKGIEPIEIANQGLAECCRTSENTKLGELQWVELECDANRRII